MTATPDVVIALDVGGTHIKGALVDRARTVHHTRRLDTGAHRGPDAVVRTIVDLARRLAGYARENGLDPVAVGLAAPGAVDEAGGVAIWSANLGLRSLPLRDLVAADVGLPVVLGHDVRAGALAEARFGAGRGVGTTWFVAIGTGIAGAYVVDGRVDPGVGGRSGEIGHVVVRPDGPPCGCGGLGCLEAIASAAAVARRYERRSGRKATARTVAVLAGTGDDTARAVWTETVDALADGLCIGVTLYDPGAVVIGGGLALAGPMLFVPLIDALRRRLTVTPVPAVVPAALGDQAGCRGAAELALDMMARA